MFFKTAIILSTIATSALSICPGYNFGVGNVQHLGNANRWQVYDSNCGQVDSLTTTENPCTSGMFECTPPPVTFKQYTNTFSGLVYACRPDPRSGKCGSDVISVCCRNDDGN